MDNIDNNREQVDLYGAAIVVEEQDNIKPEDIYHEFDTRGLTIKTVTYIMCALMLVFSLSTQNTVSSPRIIVLAQWLVAILISALAAKTLGTWFNCLNKQNVWGKIVAKRPQNK